MEDDGVGIPAADFEDQVGLGLMHYTSKFANSNETHGRSGRFLASVAASSLLSLSSRHASERGESCIVYHHSRLLVRQLSVCQKDQKIEGRNGTRVVVRDLFGNLAVRVKQRAIHFGSVVHTERELDRLKSRIAAIVLAWTKPTRITVSVDQAPLRQKFAVGTQPKGSVHGRHETVASQRTSNFRLDHICEILSHAGYITPAGFESWTSLSARTSQTFVQAAISLQPAPSKQVQFISLDIHPLDSSSTLSQALYREVNTLFAESSFGVVDDYLDTSEEHLRGLKDQRLKNDRYTDKQLRRKGKGVDRWPMFYIRIIPTESGLPPDILNTDEHDRQAAKFLERTVQLIRSMMLQFLQERNFRPRAKKRRGGLKPIDKRFTSNGPSSDAPALLQSIRRSAECDHHVSGARKIEPDPSPANLVPSQGQTKSQKIPLPVPFASWSRIKSGRARGLEDLLSGLPRSKSNQDLRCDSSELLFTKLGLGSGAERTMSESCLTEMNLGRDVQLLLQQLSDDSDREHDTQEVAFEHNSPVASQVIATELHKVIPTPKDSNDGDDILVWRNPISGKSIRINSRTGLFLPDLPLAPTDKPQSWSLNLSVRLPHNIRRSVIDRRIDARQPNMSEEVPSVPDNWLRGLLTGWENQVFCLKERPIPSAVMEHDENRAADAHKGRHAHNGRLSKSALESANVLGQVDKKFILGTMKILRSGSRLQGCSDFEDTALVLVDQHAADERCRAEAMYAELNLNKAAPVRLPKPITFEVTARESELFIRERAHFETWGIIYNFDSDANTAKKNVQGVRPASARPHSAKAPVDKPQQRPATAIAPTNPAPLLGREAAEHSGSQVAVHALPELIAERCRLDPKLLIDLLRSEVWARTDNKTRTSPSLCGGKDMRTFADQERSPHTWLKDISSCPRGIIDLLNSRACRSAIMFNDELTNLECEELVRKLARCAVPFQCAHGRPSMVVVGGLDAGAIRISDHGGHGASELGGTMQTEETFMHAFERWRQQH